MVHNDANPTRTATMRPTTAMTVKTLQDGDPVGVSRRSGSTGRGAPVTFGVPIRASG